MRRFSCFKIFLISTESNFFFVFNNLRLNLVDYFFLWVPYGPGSLNIQSQPSQTALDLHFSLSPSLEDMDIVFAKWMNSFWKIIKRFPSLLLFSKAAFLKTCSKQSNCKPNCVLAQKGSFLFSRTMEWIFKMTKNEFNKCLTNFDQAAFVFQAWDSVQGIWR